MKIQRVDKSKVCLAVYALLQAAVLVFLRKRYLMTVYQTAIFYLAVSLGGIFILFLNQYKPVRCVTQIYLLFWSSVHGIVVLGFLTKGTFYLTLTQLNGVQVVNFFLGFAVFWCGYVVTKRVRTAVGIGNSFIGIVGVINHYLVRFRGAPFQSSDIGAIRTAGNVMQNYDYTPDVLLVAAVADLIIWYVIFGGVEAAEEERKNIFGKRVRMFIPDWIVTGIVLQGVWYFSLVLILNFMPVQVNLQRITIWQIYLRI